MLDFGFYNMDCLEGMRQFPDNYFELAIIDPPYGNAGGIVSRTGGAWASKFGQKIKNWDSAPESDFFEELFRVSKNQIIWGGNYFSLPPSRCFIVWRKTGIPENFTMAMCEYAWTSFDRNAKVCEFRASGQTDRFHPTQKPVALYKWILQHYAEPGDKILDTHVGSASSLIACYDLGFDYVGFEIDEEYYKLASKRLEEVKAQIRFEDLF